MTNSKFLFLVTTFFVIFVFIFKNKTLTIKTEKGLVDHVFG